MQQHHPTADEHAPRLWHPRTCGRRVVTLRVDYATTDGRVWLGLIRNLSLQGMYIDSVLCHVAHEVAPGNRITVAFVLPSGQACKLCAMDDHGDCRGCGVQFCAGHPQSFAHLARFVGTRRSRHGGLYGDR